MGQDENELFKAFYKNYLVPLKKLAFKMGVRYDDIEDVVHETIMAYYDNYELDRIDKEARRILARILYTKWMDSFRARRYAADLSLSYPEDEFLIAEKLLDKDTLMRVMDNEIYREIRSKIKELKPEWRDVIMLYSIEGRPISEVCEILGIRETVCRTRITRARKCLKEKLMKSGLFEF